MESDMDPFAGQALSLSLSASAPEPFNNSGGFIAQQDTVYNFGPNFGLDYEPTAQSFGGTWGSGMDVSPFTNTDWQTWTADKNIDFNSLFSNNPQNASGSFGAYPTQTSQTGNSILYAFPADTTNSNVNAPLIADVPYVTTNHVQSSSVPTAENNPNSIVPHVATSHVDSSSEAVPVPASKELATKTISDEIDRNKKDGHENEDPAQQKASEDPKPKRQPRRPKTKRDKATADQSGKKDDAMADQSGKKEKAKNPPKRKAPMSSSNDTAGTDTGPTSKRRKTTSNNPTVAAQDDSVATRKGGRTIVAPSRVPELTSNAAAPKAKGPGGKRGTNNREGTE
ncbi:hypothetical protein AAF712_003202 [Marasmius tenuissimus]|uniref:Uncharacterized protein n=1 Tax=Marasmius tenuissimus TaxID=585030 RepID=A0ABR3A852_9AGAR